MGAFIRALFVAGNEWCDGIQPPPSLWLGAPNDAQIARDANGNALVRFVGRQLMNTTAYRLPEVAMGENRYIPVAPEYEDGTFLGSFRVLAGGHVDLTDRFTDHANYVQEVTEHARRLEESGYLLEADADAIILRAIQSDIGS
ncbi:MAG TPA: alpha/beta hydrolase domain-containing protein [Chthoniobacteraceae bacterium]|nr:alpha/beta hydrolase domain-containing protein [Chthoniobacteraceae bacterium]